MAQVNSNISRLKDRVAIAALIAGAGLMVAPAGRKP